MGLLSCFNLPSLALQHGCWRWLETGTAAGEGVAHALRVGVFRELHSIEAHEATHAAACRRFAQLTGNREPRTENIHLHLGHTPDVLARLLPTWAPGPTFFWLDAHFPGADVGAADYTAEPDPARRWPLQGELDALAASPEIAREAVILIDDLRIYTGQAWNYAHCRAGALDLRRPLGEIPGASHQFPGGSEIAPPLNLSAFAESHTPEVWHWMEGYLLLVPNTDSQTKV